MQQLQVGDRVDLPRAGWHDCGVVRYRGPLKGVPGVPHTKVFLGIELDDAACPGKNDGSVGGHRLFQCGEGRGVFCRPQIVRRTSHSPHSHSHSSSAQASAPGLATPTSAISAIPADPAVSAEPGASAAPRRNQRVQYDSNGRPVPPSSSSSSATTTATAANHHHHRVDAENSHMSSNKGAASLRTPPASGGTRQHSAHQQKRATSGAKQRTRGGTRNHPHNNNSSSSSSSSSGSGSGNSKASTAPGRRSGSARVFRGRRTFDATLCRMPGIKGLQNLGNTCFVNSVPILYLFFP